MAQAYEYEVLVSGESSAVDFAAELNTKDGDGWEVIEFTALSGSFFVALLRRRI